MENRVTATASTAALAAFVLALTGALAQSQQVTGNPGIAERNHLP